MFDALDPFLNVMAVGILIMLAILAIVLVIWLGSLPGTIAEARQHPQTDAVRTAGWLGLLMPPLWFLAMVWAKWNGTPAKPTEVSQ